MPWAIRFSNAPGAPARLAAQLITETRTLMKQKPHFILIPNQSPLNKQRNSRTFSVVAAR